MGELAELVWFKRDLRIEDHAPLKEASLRGPVICLYIYEPECIETDEYGAHHHRFINEALAELIHAIRSRGGCFLLRRGEAVETFEALHRECRFRSLWSHAETGNQVTYARDTRVAAWCRDRGIIWREYRQDGVVRRLRTRDGWSKRWNKTMHRELVKPPEHLSSANIDSAGEILSAQKVGLEPTSVTKVQRGGAFFGAAALDSFLSHRGVEYRSAMSSPLRGEEGCSRLSPYLAWGCLSLKTIVRATERRVGQLKVQKKETKSLPTTWMPSLRSFQSRLRWHCHFMQKLEDEPELEFRNLCRSFDGMREEAFDETLFQAWCEGRTGYPMVDACIRSLKETGWLNFRMRAMLVSFACYHLWLHWRRPAVFLGHYFLDFEPGIHFSQVQMQAGTTGINTIRIYSPTKQAQDQDPEGVFLRRWLPELTGVPLSHLFEPYRMSRPEQLASGCVIGSDYPAPIVDHSTAYRDARMKLSKFRRRTDTQEAAKEVLTKHGSRKGQRSQRNKKRPSRGPTSPSRINPPELTASQLRLL